MAEFIESVAYIILVFLALILITPLIIILMAIFAICLPFIVLYCILTGDE